MSTLKDKVNEFAEIAKSLPENLQVACFEVKPLYDDLKTTKTSESQIRVALLLALRKAMTTGEFEVETMAIKDECIERKCYDVRNFGNNFNNRKSLFDFGKFTKDTSTVRLAEAAKICLKREPRPEEDKYRVSVWSQSVEQLCRFIRWYLRLAETESTLTVRADLPRVDKVLLDRIIMLSNCETVTVTPLALTDSQAPERGGCVVIRSTNRVSYNLLWDGTSATRRLLSLKGTLDLSAIQWSIRSFRNRQSVPSRKHGILSSSGCKP